MSMRSAHLQAPVDEPIKKDVYSSHVAQVCGRYFDIACGFPGR